MSEAHEGRLWVKSLKDQGTCFSLAIPLEEPPKP